MCIPHAGPPYGHWWDETPETEHHLWSDTLNLRMDSCMAWTCRAPHAWVCSCTGEFQCIPCFGICMEAEVVLPPSQEPNIWCFPVLGGKLGNGSLPYACSWSKLCGHLGTARANKNKESVYYYLFTFLRNHQNLNCCLIAWSKPQSNPNFITIQVTQIWLQFLFLF